MKLLLLKACPALLILLVSGRCATAQVAHRLYTGTPAPTYTPHTFRAPAGMAGMAARSKVAASAKMPLSLPFRQPTGVKVCYDTSGRYYLMEDTMTYFVNASIRSTDGSVLICGEWESTNAPNPTGGFLMKCTDTGTVKWARLYDSLGHQRGFFVSYYKLLELQDGSIILAGSTDDPVTGNNDIVLTRTDNAGNLIWTQCYKSRLWAAGSGSSDYFGIQQLVQDPASGDVFFTSPHWNIGKNVTRIHVADGTVAWSRFYQINYNPLFDRSFGLAIEPDAVVCFGTALGSFAGSFRSMFRLDKNTGDTLSTRFFAPDDPSQSNFAFLGEDQVVKLNNGHYVLTGELERYYHWTATDTTPYLYHAAMEEFDANGNFVRAYCFRNDIESNFSSTRLQVYPDGSGFFSMLHYISGFTSDVYYVQFDDGQILHQRKRHYIQGMPLENRALRMADGGDVVIKTLGDSIDNINKVEFLTLHISDSSTACLGVADSSTFVQPYTVSPLKWGLDSLPENDVYVTRPRTITVRTDAPYFGYACQQLSHCDSFLLLPSVTSVCMPAPLVLTARRSLGCGASVFLDYDTAMVGAFQQLNDSMYSFNFKASGNITLRGTIRGCNLLSDSVKIGVSYAKGPVDLGPDTVLCVGNKLLLHADTGYVSYLWQDGSTDSLFTVTQPGAYSVTVTTGCGTQYSASVQVSPHAPIPFDLGPDRSKCNDDTLHLVAPSGFLNYSWGPSYTINVDTGASVIVNPPIDTAYFAAAEQSPGCFAYDTLRVIVNRSPVIFLGNDTSFCSGDSTVLDAGAGFSSYLWSDGSTASRLVVHKAGAWSVKAMDGNGCSSYDTMDVVSVWPLPVIGMSDDSLLCYGSVRVLEPGNFSSYRWQDGSTGSTFSVSDMGRYWVTVTDSHQCVSADTVLISRILPLPADFLPPDSSVCVYGKTELKAVRSFSSYLWSTGATDPSIIVTGSGTFELRVTDAYGCTGADTITLVPKQCLIGFHMPGAFSPNNDGHNDVLRPILGGFVAEYHFTVYNRYGMIVFSSDRPEQGWDGTYNGQAQGVGTYVWTCVYAFDGQPKEMEKGTVLLVR